MRRALVFAASCVLAACGGSNPPNTSIPAPNAPTIGTATPGDKSATVTWTGASSGGTATGYLASAYLASATGTPVTTVPAVASATSAQFTGLTNGTAYVFAVVARNAQGDSPASAFTSSVTPYGLPGAPGNIDGVATNAQVVLTWSAADANGDPITGYTVTASPGSATTTTTSTTATFSGLTNGTAYTFSIAATNGAGKGAAGTSAKLTPHTIPGAPTGLTATPGSTSIAFSWTAPSDNGGAAITSYNFETSPDGSAWSAYGAPVATTSITVTGLSAGQTIHARVSANNSAGTGPVSAQIAAGIASLPGAPGKPAASAAGTTATLSWTPAAPNGGAVDHYTVAASANGGTYASVSATFPTATTAAVANLTAGTTYTFEVSAHNAAGNGPYSVPSDALLIGSVPGAPASPITATAARNQATVSFGAASGNGSAVDSYTVVATPGPATASGSASPITVTGLTNGTSYTFQVFAHNAIGLGSGSATSNAVIPHGVADAPSGLSATTSDIRQSTLSWTGPADNGGSAISGWLIQQQAGSGSFSTIAPTVTALGNNRFSAVASGLANGSPYTFTVAAQNSDGNSASASSTQITTARLPIKSGISSAVGADSSANLTWTDATAEANHAITSYVVTASPGGAQTTFNSAALSGTVTGLTNGTTYTFTIHGHNDVGDGPESDASAGVVPGSNTCGNGKTDPGEQCDPTDPSNVYACNSDCTYKAASCGNHVLEFGEQCDDGNKTPGDGCENDCTATVCGPSSAPASGATCEVSQAAVGADGSMLITGNVLGEVVTASASFPKVYGNGQVLIQGGKVACAGCNCASGATAATVQINCTGASISPGLINAHDHMTYQQAPTVYSANTRNERYDNRQQWRLGLDGHASINDGTSSSSASVLHWAELRQVLAGTTSIAASSSSGPDGLVRNLDTGAHQDGLGEGVDGVDYETFPLGDSGSRITATTCGSPQDPAQIPGDSMYLGHVSEGIEALSNREFTCVASDTTSASQSLVTGHSAFIHGVALNATQIAQMAQAGTSLVWSPRTNIQLYGDTALVAAYKASGVNIALGTDWLQSGSMNILRELKCAESFNSTYLNGTFRGDELWHMATASAADALQVGEKIGRLLPGKIADVAIFKGRSDPYETVLDANYEDVALVVRGGKVIAGDQAIVNALAAGCDAIDLCSGANVKAACLQSDIATSYATLAAANTSAYPLAFCGGATPDTEPSCTPKRDYSWISWEPNAKQTAPAYDGVPKAGDADGDGVPDDQDNCPTVFNPIRPEDTVAQGGTGLQADSDGDGIGDACDPCPLNPDKNCKAVGAIDPNDIDNDGVPNAVDNCPEDFNPEQTDTNGDGHGDACQVICSSTSGGICVTTIGETKKIGSGGVAFSFGQTVQVSGQVTAISTGSSAGVYLQNGNGDYSGIFAFGAVAGVNVGDNVSISGKIGDHTGQLQIGTPVVAGTNVGGVTAPTPLPIALATFASDPLKQRKLDASLITIAGNLSVSGSTASTFTITDGTSQLTVSSLLFKANQPRTGEGLTSVTGILELRNGLVLLPRSAADVAWSTPVPALTPATGTTYTRVGHAMAPSFPTPLQITIPNARTTDLTFNVTADSSVTLGSPTITIPAGQTSASIPMTGAQRALSATVSVSYASQTPVSISNLRVLDNTDVPALQPISAADLVIAPGGSLSETVSYDIPVTTDTAVTVHTSPAADFTAPLDGSQIIVGADQTTSASFVITAASSPTSPASISISDGITGPLTTSVDFNVVCAPAVVISQVYGGGGNSGATLKNDFIELHNRTSAPVSLAGWSLQYNSATSSSGTWPTANITALSGTIPANGYFLVQESQGTGGTANLPTPDLTGSIAIGATNGKIALSASTTALSGQCPAGLLDLVGFGTANCFEGTAATAPLSNTTAALRNDNGCADNNQNSTDFTVGAPNPRNSASPTFVCTSCTQ